MLNIHILTRSSDSGSSTIVGHTSSSTPPASQQDLSRQDTVQVPNGFEPPTRPVEILVAGSLANDTVCDYVPFKASADSITPIFHTSNLSSISQSPGGVGRNVAMAAHFVGASVRLTSAVADDLAGSSLLDHVARSGLQTDAIRKFPTTSGARTAQYVAVNDTNKDLLIAMADMSIFARPELESPEYWMAKLERSKPKWVVVDANWSPSILSSIFKAAKAHKALIAFEPVSVAKAGRLFHKENTSIASGKVVPNHVVSLATPTSMELKAIYNAARDATILESEQWWTVIDSFGLSGARSQDRLISVAGRELVEQGIPQQCIQLLPFIPNLVVKLGRKGCLLASLLQQGDPRLTQPENAPFVLSRNFTHDSGIGGLYMRRIPAIEEVPQEDIVSVNGIGDSFLGGKIPGREKFCHMTFPCHCSVNIVTG